jgi:hypothetical protein
MVQYKILVELLERVGYEFNNMILESEEYMEEEYLMSDLNKGIEILEERLRELKRISLSEDMEERDIINVFKRDNISPHYRDMINDILNNKECEEIRRDY